MAALAQKVLGNLHFSLEQVQDLTPTPMTLSSTMFYMGENPYTGEKVFVARSQDDKRKQKSYFFHEEGASPRPAPAHHDQRRAPKGAKRGGSGRSTKS